MVALLRDAVTVDVKHAIMDADIFFLLSNVIRKQLARKGVHAGVPNMYFAGSVKLL